MDRRALLQWTLASGGATLCGLAGCRGKQYAQVLDHDDADMVGSHAAGAETFNPLISDAVSQLLGRQATAFSTVSRTQVAQPGELPAPKTPETVRSICFVGVENKSMEELGDFKDQIYQQIDTQIVDSRVFRPISRRFVDAGLRKTRLRPDSLFVPDNMQMFNGVMNGMGQSFDYLLYATLTTGTTASNKHDYQRDYLLTLELVNVHSGAYDKQSAKVRKGYHQSKLGALRHYNPFKKK